MWVVNATPRPFYLRERNSVPIVQEAGWAPGPVWMGAKNSATTGVRSRTVQAVASRYIDWTILAHGTVYSEYYAKDSVFVELLAGSTKRFVLLPLFVAN
jgi:hypothetical protein